MSRLKLSDYLLLGVTIFAMCFGSGDVVFSLESGFLSKNIFPVVLGFVLASVVFPYMGLVSTFSFLGSYHNFLSARTGKLVGGVITAAGMLLLGPTGTIPRCVTLSHAVLSWGMISTGQCAFSLIFMSLVYVFSLNKNNLLTVLGRVLGPINIFLMLWLIAKGLWTSSPSLIIETESFFSGFFLGFKNGFWTFELLATVFFAAVFFGNVKHFLLSKKIESSRELVVDIGIKAGAVSAFIFSLVYAGFITISSLHSQAIGQVVPEKLLSAYAYYFLGNTWGGVSTLIVALSCFCTTLALTMVFSDYLVYLSSEKISYRQALLLTIFVSLGFSNLGFSGIKTAMEPLVTIFYPVLMILVAREAFMFFLRKHRA